MRYWFDGVDEGIEREFERSSELGLPPPAEESSFFHFLLFVLVAIQIVSWLALAAVFFR